MIRVFLQPEPAEFDARVRIPGTTWLSRHPAGTPRNYWREMLVPLADAFADRCAYSARCLDYGGEVDHFVPLHENRDLAYDWSNYRYCDPRINKLKRNTPSRELLDPFTVEDDWFVLGDPDLRLWVTDRCPPELRARAWHTLTKLKLHDGVLALKVRRRWVEAFTAGHATLELLAAKAPLVAQMLRRRLIRLSCASGDSGAFPG